MRFLIRSAHPKDLEALYRLASLSPLFSLTPDRQHLEQKIHISCRSFCKKEEPEASELLFVLEDLQNSRLIGSSQIYLQYVSPRHPHYLFRIRCRAGGQVMQLHKYTRPMSLLCGLVVDPAYRKHPEMLGRQISLIRLLFAGMAPDRFESVLLTEFLPPLDEHHQNPFWEQLGRKITGLSYEEALNRVELRDLGFIETYFSEREIVLTPMQKALHRNRDSIFKAARPARHILEQQGFRYREEVHPVDGALEYSTELEKVQIIRQGRWFRAVHERAETCRESAYAGVLKNDCFRGGKIACRRKGESIGLAEDTLRGLCISSGQQIFVSSI